MAEDRADRSRPGRGPHQRHLPGRAPSLDPRPTRQLQSDRRHPPRLAHRLLAHRPRRGRLSRARCGLGDAPTLTRASNPPPRPTTRSPRSARAAHRRRMTTQQVPVPGKGFTLQPRPSSPGRAVAERFALIEAEKANYKTAWMCRMLHVPRSSSTPGLTGSRRPLRRGVTVSAPLPVRIRGGTMCVRGRGDVLARIPHEAEAARAGAAGWRLRGIPSIRSSPSPSAQEAQGAGEAGAERFL
jgi:hypothetical protein